MLFCPKCGSQAAEGVAFCEKCGAPQSAAAPTSGAPSAQPTATAPVGSGETGLQENIAGLLCYALGWVTGLIFYFVDKRPFVRFHAAQSIVVFGGLHIILILLGHFFGFGFFFGGMGWGGFGFVILLYDIVKLLTLVLWILLMIKAAQHEKFRLPIAADFADQLARKHV